MFVGIVLGIATAFMQSLSYLASGYFIRKHNSALKLLITSHVAMGVVSAVLMPFFWDGGILQLSGAVWLALGVWIMMFMLGQMGFFISQKLIEPSRLASLLGLKIVVLSLIWIFFFGQTLNFLQITGVVLSVAAAFAMNWSGGRHFEIKSLIPLVMTLVCYSLTDLSETRMVLLCDKGDIVHAGISVTLLCYTVLGICSLPALFKTGWNFKMQCHSLPFSLLWLGSQMTLLICFGIIGPVFGNVIQSSRGIFSVVFGVLVCRLGFDVMENSASGKLWLRRAMAALLMIGGIVCFSFGKIIAQ